MVESGDSEHVVYGCEVEGHPQNHAHRHSQPTDEREAVAKALYDHEPLYHQWFGCRRPRRHWRDLRAHERARYLARADVALTALSGRNEQS